MTKVAKKIYSEQDKTDFLSRIRVKGDMICLIDLWKESGCTRSRSCSTWLKYSYIKMFIEIYFTALRLKSKSDLILKIGSSGAIFAHKYIALAYAKHLGGHIYPLVADIFFDGSMHDYLNVCTEDTDNQDYRDWAKIPEIPGYEINLIDHSVRSFLLRTPRILKPARGECYNFRINGRSVSFTRKSLLYAVDNNISPLKLPDDSVIMERGKELVLVSRKLFYKTLGGAHRKGWIGESEVINEYENRKMLIEKINRYYKTGDIKEISQDIYSHRDDLIEYILKREFSRNRKNAIDIADAAIELLIDHIINHKIIISNLLSVMKIFVRRIVSEKHKFKIMSFNENIRYKNNYEIY